MITCGINNTEQYQARLAVKGRPTKDAWGPLFDPRAVDNLRSIIDNTDAAIVISSSWRYLHRLGSLRMMWEVRELPRNILSTRSLKMCGVRFRPVATSRKASGICIRHCFIQFAICPLITHVPKSPCRLFVTLRV